MLITHPVDVPWLSPREMNTQLKGTVLLKGKSMWFELPYGTDNSTSRTVNSLLRKRSKQSRPHPAAGVCDHPHSSQGCLSAISNSNSATPSSLHNWKRSIAFPNLRNLFEMLSLCSTDWPQTKIRLPLAPNCQDYQYVLQVIFKSRGF